MLERPDCKMWASRTWIGAGLREEGLCSALDAVRKQGSSCNWASRSISSQSREASIEQRHRCTGGATALTHISQCAGRIMFPKHVPAPVNILWSTARGTNVANQLTFGYRGHPGLSRWAQCHHEVLKCRQGRQNTRVRVRQNEKDSTHHGWL